jgi:hypothetical protein
MMRAVVGILGAALVLIAPCWSWAGVYQVVGETKDWTPVSGSPLPYLLSITNPDNYNVNPVAGWSLKLQIVPDSGATGSVSFLSASMPSQDYLFAGRSSGLIPPFCGPSQTINLISDMDAQFTGVTVPQAGMSLLQLQLTASADATGQFNIEAVPGSDLSYWMYIDAIALEGVPVAFQNVPFTGNNVTLGSVTIPTVPEPPTLISIAALLGFAAFRVCRRLVGQTGFAPTCHNP